MIELHMIPGPARRILDRMCDLGQSLPSDWDEGEFCLDAAIDLAGHLARHDWRISQDDEAMMHRIGAVLLRSVYHQLEAGNLADSMTADLRHGGACG